MEEDGAYGDRLSDRFGVHQAPTLVTTTLRDTKVAVTLIESDRPATVMSEPIPVEDAFLVQLNLQLCPDHEYWANGRSQGRRTFQAGETIIHDLKQEPRALIHSRMGSMLFYFSRELLNETCDDAGAPRIGDLAWQPGNSGDDATVRSIGGILEAAMRRPDEPTPLFVDHLTLALAAHIATTYGGMRAAHTSASGGLAPWQERRAKEILATGLDGKVPLSLLAQECGLSVSHFSRSFRRTLGEPPHRWLLKQRVERAKTLLRDGRLSIAEVALSCGFSDQSHLTRSFTGAVGVGPAAWRRHLSSRRTPAAF